MIAIRRHRDHRARLRLYRAMRNAGTVATVMSLTVAILTAMGHIAVEDNWRKGVVIVTGQLAFVFFAVARRGHTSMRALTQKLELMYRHDNA